MTMKCDNEAARKNRATIVWQLETSWKDLEFSRIVENNLRKVSESLD